MKNKFSLQYASNFFLNLHKRRDFENMLIPSSNNLAILGNVNSLDSKQSIEDYNAFLHYVSSKWKNVYLVPGPYEYVSRKLEVYDHTLIKLYNIKKEFKNIQILNNSNVNISSTDITLVGCTLWVKQPYYILPCCFEFSYINKIKRDGNTGPILGNDIYQWFQEDVAFVKNLIKNSSRSIVLTHHLPSYSLTKNSIKTRMEASYLEALLKPSVPIWLGGAGSKTVSGTLGLTKDTFCAVNTYTTFDRPEFINTNYDPKAVVSLRLDSIELY